MSLHGGGSPDVLAATGSGGGREDQLFSARPHSPLLASQLCPPPHSCRRERKGTRGTAVREAGRTDATTGKSLAPHLQPRGNNTCEPQAQSSRHRKCGGGGGAGKAPGVERAPELAPALADRHSLGVGFLQQGAPELVVVRGVEEDQTVPEGGQSVIHHHVQPLTVLPEL